MTWVMHVKVLRVEFYGPQLTSREPKSPLKISKFSPLVKKHGRFNVLVNSSWIKSPVNFGTVCVPIRSILLFISEIACLTMKSLSRFVLSVSGTNRALDLTFDASTEVALSVYSRKGSLWKIQNGSNITSLWHFASLLIMFHQFLE